jgi:hypothetical protein
MKRYFYGKKGAAKKRNYLASPKVKKACSNGKWKTKGFPTHLACAVANKPHRGRAAKAAKEAKVAAAHVANATSAADASYWKKVVTQKTQQVLDSEAPWRSEVDSGGTRDSGDAYIITPKGKHGHSDEEEARMASSWSGFGRRRRASRRRR